MLGPPSVRDTRGQRCAESSSSAAVASNRPSLSTCSSFVINHSLQSSALQQALGFFTIRLHLSALALCAIAEEKKVDWYGLVASRRILYVVDLSWGLRMPRDALEESWQSLNFPQP